MFTCVLLPDAIQSHLVEPRFDEFQSEKEKLQAFTSANEMPTLRPFREAIAASSFVPGRPKVITAGGYTYDNAQDCISNGEYDAVAFGRYFTSNADLVERLREGKPFYRYHRPRFYGPFDDDPAQGYTNWDKLPRVFADDTDRGQAQLV